MCHRFYPGYVMRLYHDFTAEDNPDDMKLLCDAFCMNPDIDLCDSRNAG